MQQGAGRVRTTTCTDIDAEKTAYKRRDRMERILKQ